MGTALGGIGGSICVRLPERRRADEDRGPRCVGFRICGPRCGGKPDRIGNPRRFGDGPGPLRRRFGGRDRPGNGPRKWHGWRHLRRSPA